MITCTLLKRERERKRERKREKERKKDNLIYFIYLQ
jgi:hypothetical protein